MGDGLGWPVLRPVRRVWTWFIRAAVTFFAAGSLLQVVDVLVDPGDRPLWRWALIVVGAVVALVASSWTWLLAGRLHRLTWDPLQPPPTAVDRRAARKALRTGADLTGRQRRLVAYEVGQLETATVLAVGFAAQFGSQVVSWSAQSTPRSSSISWYLAATFTVQLSLLGGIAIALWRGRRLRDAAARVGAVPLRAADL